MSKPLKLKNSMAGSVRSVRTDKSMKSGSLAAKASDGGTGIGGSGSLC